MLLLRQPWRLARRLARWAGILSTCSALGVGFSTGPPAYGSGPPAALTLAMDVGYNGAVPPTGWTAVRVTLDASGQTRTFRGTLEVWTGDRPPQELALGAALPANSRVGAALQQTQPPSALQQSVAVPPGTRQVVTFFVLDNRQMVSAEVQDHAGHVVTATHAAPVAPPTGPQVAVVSDDPAALSAFGNLALPGPAAALQILRPSLPQLPGSGVALRAFSLIAIDDVATAALTTAQRQALGDYVAGGGSLLVVGGPGAPATTAGLPPSLLALDPTGTVTVAGLPEVSSELGVIPLATATVLSTGITQGEADLAEGGLPVLSERSVGEGTAFFASADLDAAPLAGWDGQAQILQETLLRSLLPGIIPAGWALAPNSGFLSAGGWLYQALDRLPTGTLAAVWPALVAVLLYGLVAVPGGLWLARRRGRPAVAWAVLPVAAIVVGAVITDGAVLMPTSPVAAAQVAVIRLLPGTSEAYVEAAAGVFAPQAGTLHLSASLPAGSRGLAAPVQPFLTNALPSVPPIITDEGAGVAADVTAAKAGDLVTIGTQSFQPAPGALVTDLVVSRGRITGTVTSHLPAMLTGAEVISGSAVEALGTITPGAGRAVDVAAPGASAGPAAGGLPALLMATQHGPGAPAMQPLVTQLLQGSVDAVSPTLVGWLQSPAQGVYAGGRRARTTSLTAVVVPLGVRAGASLGLGDLLPRVVGLRGGITPVVALSGLRTFGNLSPGASEMLEFAAGRGTAPAVSMPGLVPGATVEVFDVATGLWAPIALGSTSATPLPDPSGDVSPDGLVRLRVTNASGHPVSASSLSLTVP